MDKAKPARQSMRGVLTLCGNLQAGGQRLTGESQVKAAVLFLLSFPKGLRDAASLVLLRRARLLRK